MSFRGDDEELPKSPEEVINWKFFRWNGDPPVPKVSHWTAQGTITIRVATPVYTTEVLWKGEHIGYDRIFPSTVLTNLLDGKYDKDFGFAISEVVPKKISDWNDLD